jgi:hypothetical protein
VLDNQTAYRGDQQRERGRCSEAGDQGEPGAPASFVIWDDWTICFTARPEEVSRS